MTKGLLTLVFGALAIVLLGAQVWPRAPRANSNPALSTTASAPSGTPAPELPANLPTKTRGRSSTVDGALHLVECVSYQVTVCAASGQTLSGGGALDVYYWSDWSTGTTITTWPKNPGLAESVTGTGRCQTFPTHKSTGLGWIYVAPNAVTVSGGSTVNVLIEAVCAS